MIGRSSQVQPVACTWIGAEGGDRHLHGGEHPIRSVVLCDNYGWGEDIQSEMLYWTITMGGAWASNQKCCIVQLLWVLREIFNQKCCNEQLWVGWGIQSEMLQWTTAMGVVETYNQKCCIERLLYVFRGIQSKWIWTITMGWVEASNQVFSMHCPWSIHKCAGHWVQLSTIRLILCPSKPTYIKQHSSFWSNNGIH